MKEIANELCAGALTLLRMAAMAMMLVGTLVGLREAGRRQ